MLLKYKIPVLLFMLFPLSLWAEGEPDGKLRQYRDVMWLENIRFGSTNPVSISDIPFNSLFGLGVGYSLEDGGFRNVDAPRKENDLQVNIFGVKQLKKIAFEGGISYYNEVQRDRKWNSTLFISSRNPFILADSIAGKFNVEKFLLEGGFSLPVSSRVRLGLRAEYEAGSSADQTDPRPDTKSMRFGLTPGADVRLGKEFTLGISARIGWLSESVKYSSVVGGVNHIFFLFNGLGNFYPSAGTAYERKYKGQSYGGNLQFVWEGRNGLSNLFEGGLEYGNEDATDGGAQREFKGGKYKSKLYRLSDRFQMKGDRMVHNITLGMQMQQVDGIWYEQKDEIDDNGSTYWKVVSSSVKHKEDRMSGSVGYRLDVLKDELPRLTLEVEGGYLHSEIKNYPELQKQTFSLINGDARLTKYLNIRNSLLGIFVQGGIRQAGDAALNADGIKLAGEYTRPSFEYVSADYWKAGGGVNLKVPLQLKDFNSYIGAFARYTSCRYAGDFESYKDTSRNRIDFGVDFTF